MWDLVQITAEYSNAVLVAVMPYVADFEKKLDLPVAPITASPVMEFKCDPRQGQVGGALLLTNGFRFTFLDGRICIYRSPQSYYSLQDPEMIPRFYGPVKLKETEALQIVRDTIKKLGYDQAAFNLASAPLVTPPEKIGTNIVPRYRFRWLDTNRQAVSDASSIRPTLLDIELNASDRRVEMMVISSRETRRPSPVVNVIPPLLQPKATKPKLMGGQQTTPVTGASARAFLNAILPQLSDFADKAGLNLPLPITTNQVVNSNYHCWILEGQPMAQLYLTNGDRFNYGRGGVSSFYAHDAFMKFPKEGRLGDFLGHINMSTNEAIALCESVMRKIGYAGVFPPPFVSYPLGSGELVFTRYTYYWKHPGADSEFASFEVDMETKTIKNIYLNDVAFQKESPQLEDVAK